MHCVLPEISGCLRGVLGVWSALQVAHAEQLSEKKQAIQRYSLDKQLPYKSKVVSGAPERIRTSDLCLRRAALYPAELRVLCYTLSSFCLYLQGASQPQPIEPERLPCSKSTKPLHKISQNCYTRYNYRAMDTS